MTTIPKGLEVPTPKTRTIKHVRNASYSWQRAKTYVNENELQRPQFTDEQLAKLRTSQHDAKAIGESLARIYVSTKNRAKEAEDPEALVSLCAFLKDSVVSWSNRTVYSSSSTRTNGLQACAGTFALAA